MYLTEEQTLCGEPTLAVEAFYRECDLEIDTGEHEPDDHLGLMFAFMTNRLGRMISACESDESIDDDLNILQIFLSEHVLTWAPRFLEIMKDNAQLTFIRESACL